MSEAWAKLATAALLGTERAAAIPAGEPITADLLAQVPGDRPERRLLMAAAMSDLCLRAGLSPQGEQEAFQPANAETLSAVSAHAGQRLNRIFSGEFDLMLLPMWLDLCAKAKRRVRDRDLPALFDRADGNPAVRERLTAVIGERGRWYAALTSKGRAMISELTPAAWDTGKKPERLAYFKQIRKSDPAAARALLEKTWSQETPEERASFIDAFAAGLSMDDEPFLETALDDSRKEVRDAAIDLLSRLGESRRSRRMQAHAEAFVKIIAKRGVIAALAGQPRIQLDVTLPQNVTPEMERDGIAAKAASVGLGEKASQLLKILSGAPLPSFAAAPLAEIIKTAKVHEFSIALLMGWSHAAVYQKNIIWLEILLSDWIAVETSNAVYNARALIRGMIAALDIDRRESTVQHCLKAAKASLDGTPVMEMLDACDHAWTPQFSQTVINAITLSMANQGNAYQYQVRQFVEKRAGYFAHPAVAAALLQLRPEATAAPANSAAIDAMINILQFRNEMMKELL